MYRQIDRWVDGWMDGWMGGWLDGWMDGWMDGSGFDFECPVGKKKLPTPPTDIYIYIYTFE